MDEITQAAQSSDKLLYVVITLMILGAAMYASIRRTKKKDQDKKD